MDIGRWTATVVAVLIGHCEELFIGEPPGESTPPGTRLVRLEFAVFGAEIEK
jgi:hypothetical protein